MHSRDCRCSTCKRVRDQQAYPTTADSNAMWLADILDGFTQAADGYSDTCDNGDTDCGS